MLQSGVMRISLLALVATGCLGSTGPQLPPNVGANHAGGGEQQSEQEAEANLPPVPVGTIVWANFHDTGFYFYGVVVERREEMHRVVYADGAGEWLPAAALLPDSLGEDAQIHVRSGYAADFHAGVLGRRLGSGLYVRMASGAERWTTLPHVRFQRGEEGIPRRGDSPRPPDEVTGTGVGADVLVDYQRQGLRFAGTVTARREDGFLHIVYLDGETDWADPGAVVPDEIADGTVVHVRRSWEPPTWVRGRVQQRLGSAVRVEFEDGGTAWTSLFRIRIPVDAASDRLTDEPPPEPEPEPAPPPRRRVPARRR